jgi:predicted enzyme related to lactoylglutathione lyase
MDRPRHAITWFEIAVVDFDRAKRFYETILACTMPDWPMGDVRMAMFPYDYEKGCVGGALCHGAGIAPSEGGTHVYLWCPDGFDAILERVPKAGGAVLLPKHQVTPEIGYVAHFRDTEGNRVGLHAMR